MRYRTFFPLSLILISFVACNGGGQGYLGTRSVTEIRPPETWPVNISLSKNEKEGLVIRVNPWLRIVREGDDIEWLMHDPQGLCVDWETTAKRGSAAKFPGNAPGHRRGPFSKSSVDPVGQISHYNIQLTLNIDGTQQIITLDPDYRVDR